MSKKTDSHNAEKIEPRTVLVMMYVRTNMELKTLERSITIDSNCDHDIIVIKSVKASLLKRRES